MNINEIASNVLVKIVENTVKSLDIKVPQIDKKFWLGNYCFNLKVGGN